MKVVDQAMGEGWAMYNGDSAEVLTGLPTDSVHLSVTSIPFGSLFTYSASERDLGNSRDAVEFWRHMGYIVGEWLRVTRPGRLCCVHTQPLPRTLTTDGRMGERDLPGETVVAWEQLGWDYLGRVVIDRDPQAQAIRTKAHHLLFVTLEKDSTASWPSFADHLLLFRKPGRNPEPVTPDCTREEWIEWAHPVWRHIRESRTLNAAEAREDADERHVCPLQLDTIERCIRLWSNPGEVVADFFGGIGSTGYAAMQLSRRFIGCELKPSYWETACRNLARAEAAASRPSLLDFAAEEAAG